MPGKVGCPALFAQDWLTKEEEEVTLEKVWGLLDSHGVRQEVLVSE